MAYYLSSCVGSGTEEDPYRPPVDAPFIDLRGDGSQKEGLCFVRTRDPQTPGLLLGDSLDDPLPRQVSRALENRLGVTLDQPGRLRSIITELLLLHGTP